MFTQQKRGSSQVKLGTLEKLLDPFMGSGTMALVAKQQGRSYLEVELNSTYVSLAEERLASTPSSLWQETPTGEVG